MTTKGDEIRALAEVVLAALRKAEDPASDKASGFVDAVIMAAAIYASEVIGEPAAVERLRDRADWIESGLLRAVTRGHDFGKHG